MKSLSIVPLCTEDMPGVIALNRLHYGDSDVACPDHLHWKYAQGPDGPAHILLCKDMDRDGLIVGIVASLPRRVRINQQAALARLVTDLLVHPAYRGHKIAGRLGQAMHGDLKPTEIAFSYGVPNPRSSHAYAQQLRQWQFDVKATGLVPLLVKLIDLRSLSRRATATYARLPLSLLQGMYRVSGWVDKEHKRMTIPAMTVREVTSFDHTFDDFWIRVRDKRPVMVERSAKYLQWRFGAVPRRTYRKWVAEEADEARGYIVIRVMESRIVGVKSGMIADFLVEDNTAGQEAGHLLLSTVNEVFKAERVGVSACLMLPETTEFRLLRERGYFVCPPRLEPQPSPLMIHPYQESVSQSPAVSTAGWFFSFGDYDVV